jgi:hypothetical protein
MTGCWEKEASERPSMQEVVDKMEKLAGLFPGGDQPITEYEDVDSCEEDDEEDEDDNDDTIETYGPQTCEYKIFCFPFQIFSCIVKLEELTSD